MGMKKRGAARKQQSSKPPSPAPATATARHEDGLPILPINDWYEIFLRIPGEDLARLKRVCKGWYKLIACRFFAHAHLDRWSSRPITGLVFDMDYCFDGSSKNGIFFLSFDPDRRGEKPLHCRNFLLNEEGLTCKYRDFRIKDYACRRAERRRSEESRLLASCDGLLLIGYAEETHYQLLVCNPVTGSCRALPVFRPRGIQKFASGNISKLLEWAIVRNGSIGRYKVFGLEKFPHSDSTRSCYIVELHGVGEGQWNDKWKELDTPLDPTWSIEASTSAGGKLYWLTTLKSRHQHQVNLLSVDIAEEELAALACHELSGAQRHYLAMQGTFYCIQTRNGKLSLWVLESNSNDPMWTECSDIRLSKVSSAPNKNVLVNGETKLVISFDGIKLVFDMISRESGKIKFDSKCLLNWNPVKVLRHVNSLVWFS